MAQNFFEPGLDLSSLTSVTQAQLMQALSQMSPISNVGVVIYQAVTPNVTDNPIFARCIWADTSNGVDNVAFKFWTGTDWVVGTVAEDAIDDPASIKDGTITIIKMNGNEGTPRQVARIRAAGGRLEYVNPASLFNNSGELAVDNLAAEASENDYFLRVEDGTPVWKAYDPTLDLTNVSPSVLQGGAQHSFLVTKGSGDREWSSSPLGHINDLAKASDTLNVNKLTASGLSEGSLLRINGTGVWAGATPTINIFGSNYIDSAELANTVFSLGGLQTVTTLTAVPKYLRVVLKCVVADGSYAEGDEIDLSACVQAITSLPAAYQLIDGTSYVVKVGFVASTLFRGKTLTTGAVPANNSWKFRTYYIY